MSSLNRIILIGELETTPDIKATTTGETFANFKLKVDRPERQDGAPAQSDTLTVVAWRQVAEKAQALTQGSMAVVEGRIITRSYDDQNGVRKYVTEIEAREVHPVGSSASSAARSSAPQDSFYQPISNQSSDNFDFSQADGMSVELSPELEEEIPF